MMQRTYQLNLRILMRRTVELPSEREDTEVSMSSPGALSWPIPCHARAPIMPRNHKPSSQGAPPQVGGLRIKKHPPYLSSSPASAKPFLRRKKADNA